MTLVRFREATPEDAAAVASLHADSWRRHYRGAYADEFLDGDVFSDRIQVWTERLNAPADSTTILAEADKDLVGFAHIILDVDGEWGALLDNLHVTATKQGGGIGTALMRRVGDFVSKRRPESGLFLWVLEQNVAAQGFYQALGGKPADFQPVRPVNGIAGRLNGSPIGIRYVWPDPGALAMRSR